MVKKFLILFCLKIKLYDLFYVLGTSKSSDRIHSGYAGKALTLKLNVSINLLGADYALLPLQCSHSVISLKTSSHLAKIPILRTFAPTLD